MRRKDGYLNNEAVGMLKALLVCSRSISERVIREGTSVSTSTVGRILSLGSLVIREAPHLYFVLKAY